ncbi:cyd operon YbgE family protein [Desertibaculum subflavum]|uniref:cyd operon YbgE family protein n=1 Tax=Desertibaculum subflavum TaxID=2268458 RepID=UPI000E6616EE
MTALRLVSLALAALVGVVVLFNPDWTSQAAGWIARSGLALALIGLLGAFTYGIGHQPERRLLQLVQSPKVAWPAMLVGVMLFAVERYV